MACRPAPLFADAVVAFEAIEEGVGDERIAAVVERVPCGGGHIGQVFDDADVSQMNCPSIVQVSAASHSAHVGARGLVGAASAASSCSLPCEEIGRASCRERVCQYGTISVVDGSLKKKN